MAFVVGLDLGQKRDYSAVAVVERREQEDRSKKPLLHLRHLERYPLGLGYAEQADRVAALVRRIRLDTGRAVVLERHFELGPAPPLVVDQTGVGLGVLDLLKERDLRPIGVTITGGHATRGLHVPKTELLSRLQSPISSGRFRVAPDMPLVDKLLDEMLNFQIKQNRRTGHVSLEHWRESDHDDLVLACALACWWVERRRLVGVAAKPKGW